MSKARKRPKVVAPEWRGFSERLKYAVETRTREDDLSQNDVADAAGMDGGNLSRIMAGKKALGVQANTVVLLATALRVSPLWLLVGVEPSGLAKPPASPVEAPSGEPTPLPPSVAPPRSASR